MAAINAPRASEPLSELNTTPLIDVLLVLLVMFIITIPVATNTLEVALPGETKPPVVQTNPDRNLLVVTQDGGLLWNGSGVSDGQLAQLLADTRAMNPEPQLEYRPDADASYDRAARVLTIIKASGVSNMGFSGNERYRSFGKAG